MIRLYEFSLNRQLSPFIAIQKNSDIEYSNIGIQIIEFCLFTKQITDRKLYTGTIH